MQSSRQPQAHAPKPSAKQQGKRDAEPIHVKAKRRQRRERRLRWIVVLSVVVVLLLGVNSSPTALASLQQLQDSAQVMATKRYQAVRNALLGDVRVGVQIGHLDVANHPDEFGHLRYNTGGRANNINEVDINKAVAEALKEKLEPYNIVVDLIPATPTPNYRADLFISIHADSSPDPARRGYKSAHQRLERNSLEPVLKKHLDDAYFAHSGLPDDDRNVTGAMLHYYAFNRRYEHTVAQRTPAVIVELGYLSNAQDLAYMRNPELPAQALADGIVSYLRERGRLLD